MVISGQDRSSWIMGQTSRLDPRITLARPDIAHSSLKGKLEASRFAEGRVMTIQSPLADLKTAPRAAEGLLTQGLLGERVRVLDTNAGWAFCQILTDGYVGYMEERHLASHYPAATARVAVPLSHVYPVPDLKTPVRHQITFGARVCANLDDSRNGFSEAKGLGWIYTKHLKPLDRPETDFLRTAKRFLNCPYLWGGRSGLGLDCSALVQLILLAANIPCPRDTDQQQKMIGHSASNVPDPHLCREGDFVFFKGHVGIMADNENLLHANASNMRVTLDPLPVVIERAKKESPNGITDIRRVRV